MTVPLPKQNATRNTTTTGMTFRTVWFYLLLAIPRNKGRGVDLSPDAPVSVPQSTPVVAQTAVSLI